MEIFERGIVKSRKYQIIFVVLLLFSAFVTTSVLSYIVSLKSLRSQILANELPLSSDNIYSEIQRDLLRPIFISSLMASDTFLRDWVLSGERNKKKIQKYLKEIQNRYNTFTAFFVSDRSYNYYHATGIIKKVLPGRKRDIWYFRVKNMKNPYEINLDVDLANNDSLAIFINYKVYDYNKKFIGATGVGLNVTAVKNLIERYKKRFNRNIYFLDKMGKIIFHGSTFNLKEHNISKIPEMKLFYKEVLSKKNLRFTLKRNGKTIHVNSRYIPEFDWILIVEQLEDKAIKDIKSALLVNIILSFFISIIVLSISFLILSRYKRELERLATTDSLTKILNRTAFDFNIKKMIQDSERTKQSFSIILFDIDHFKKLNDTYGHLVGDLILQDISLRAISSIRNSDLLFRWGGEEFIVLLKGCTFENAVQIAEKLRLNIDEEKFLVNNIEIKTTISLGVTSYRSSDSIDSIIERIDLLLYEAKNNGRNLVVAEE